MSERAVSVWCLLGKKAGDNTQVRALAEELGYGYEEKHILARPWELLVHLGPGASLAGIDRESSSALQAPWPDLVISAGRRNEPVARWIKKQSGDKAALVHMGRPWASLDAWDLLVTTPQYFLPQQENILHNRLPLHRLTRDELLEAGESLGPRLAGLPRPWIAVLVGGDSGRFVLTPQKGERLGALADQLADGCGGSLLLTDSARTPVPAADALQARLSVPNYFYRWGSGEENPYRGLLAVADAFVVTGESMSMIGEAAAMDRPLYIFDVGDGAASWWRLAHNYRYKPLSHRLAMTLGPRRMRRDIGNIQDEMVADGRADWLAKDTIAAAISAIRTGAADSTRAAAGGEAAGSSVSLAEEELKRSAAAVRQLVTAR